MSNSKYSSNAVYKKAHALRNKAGLKPVNAAWKGLSTAKVQDLTKTAYKAVTWHYRSSAPADASLLRLDLVKAFAALLARQDGDHEAAAWLDAWAADMPQTWTAQYPIFGLPQPKENSDA
jgi:hypothetical protein